MKTINSRMQNNDSITARKVSKYGVFSGPCFPEFKLNTTESKDGNIRTRKNSVFGHFSRSEYDYLRPYTLESQELKPKRCYY